MSRRDLIDSACREPLDQLVQAIPGGFNTIPDIVQRRATVSGLLASSEIPPNPSVTSEDRTVPGPEGAPDITVRIYRPVDATRTLPGIYFIHGGGMILGNIDETPSSYEITDLGLWDRAGNIEAWKWYLGDGKPDQYAAPARAEDLTGLPPTYIDVGTLDLFRDEDIAFA
jgi:acetyl esterase/lipase